MLTFNLRNVPPSSSTNSLMDILVKCVGYQAALRYVITAIVQYPADFNFAISLAPIPVSYLSQRKWKVNLD